MKRFFKLLIGVAIVALAAAFCVLLFLTRPKAEKKEEVANFPVVETIVVKLESVEIELPSQGIVEAKRRTRLAAEVAGKVIEVSDKFFSGETFAKDEVMLKLEDTEYQAILAETKATLANTITEKKMEEARVEQAKRDWKNLGTGGDAKDLVLRQPQLEAAKARVSAAEAAVAKATRDLERTEIRAPYPATIASKDVDIGAYVSPGMEIAEVFETNPFEVRLPISVDDARFLKLDKNGDPEGTVEVNATAGGTTRTWNGRIVRTEREIDRSTRSLYVVAEIDALNRQEGIALQPGLFITATITGRTMEGLTRVPFPAFLDLDHVAVVEDTGGDQGEGTTERVGKIRFRKVEIARREDNDILVSSGLNEGEKVSLTELNDVVEGMKVKIQEDKEEEEEESEPRLTSKP